MQIKWIEDLLAINHTKSFSRAAELRFITQSALSRRIKALEEWVGVKLVDRSTYPVKLTAAGRRFCESSSESVDSLRTLCTELRQEARMPGKSIQITAGHTLSMTFLPRWLHQYHQLNEEFNARVVAANVHDAVVALAEDACDLMIAHHHPLTPFVLNEEKFESIVLGRESFMPVSAPDGHGRPIFSLPGSARQQLPYVAYSETTFMGRIVDMILNTAGRPCHLKRCYEADMAMMLAKMVAERYGIAWLPESCIHEEIAAGRLVPAGGSQWSTQLEIRAYRAIGNSNPTMVELWESMKSNIAQEGPPGS